MKMSNILKFALDSMLWRKKSTAAIVAIVTITLTLLDVASTEYCESIYMILRAREIVQEPLNEACYVKNLYIPTEDQDYSMHLTQFMSAIKEIPEVEYSGRYYEMLLYFSREETDDSGIELPVFVIDRELLPLCGIEYQLYENIDIDASAHPIFVGADIRESFEPGQMLFCGEDLYQIVGYLSEGSAWLSSGFGNAAEAEINLDQRLLCFVDETYIAASGDYGGYIFMSNIYMALKNSSDFEQAAVKISDTASEYNLVMKLQTMNEQLRQLRINNRKEINEHLILLIFVFLICIISITSVSMVGILLQKRIYGTLYACGVGMRDFVKIFIIKNGILIFFAAAVSLIYRIYSIRFNEYNAMLVMRVHNMYVIGFVLLVDIVLLILTSIIPIAYFRHLTPSEMLRTGEE